MLKAVEKFPRRGVHPYYDDTLPMLLVGVGESRIHFTLFHIPLYAMKNRIGASDVGKGLEYFARIVARHGIIYAQRPTILVNTCLLYTSDAADE